MMKTFLFRLLNLMVTLPFGLWGVLSLWFGSWPGWMCTGLAVLYGSGSIFVILFTPLRHILPMQAGLFILPLLSFLFVQPSHDRLWQEDVAVMPYVEKDGSKLVVHNMRNNSYVTAMDYTTRFETRTFDLDKLRSMDVLLTDWGLKHIVHTMISFGFEGGKYVCLSVETRKEEGEEYSALKGFFRQYELIYVLADERDLVRLRTNFRKREEVFLYRLRVASLENLRLTFLSFMDRVNELHARPQWYNALYENCMTSAFRIARKHAAGGHGFWHWSLILNGHSARHAYNTGLLDTTLAFNDFQGKSHINPQAQKFGDSEDFSVQIRKELPGMEFLPEN